MPDRILLAALACLLLAAGALVFWRVAPPAALRARPDPAGSAAAIDAAHDEPARLSLPPERDLAPERIVASAGDGELGAARLHGRLLDPSGRPRRGTCDACLGTSPAERTWLDVELGADGRFEVLIPDSEIPRGTELWLAFEAGGEPHVMRTRQARVALRIGALVSGEVRDLGNIRLHAWSARTWIEVVDEDGETTRDVTVAVLDERGTVIESLTEEASAGSLSLWKLEPVFPARIELAASQVGCVQAAPVAFDPNGTTEQVRIVLRRGGRIVGKLVAGERIGLDLVAVRARSEIGLVAGAQAAAPRWGEIQHDGRFEIDQLEPGEYAFELTSGAMQGRDVPLLTIPGVRVVTAVPTRDPRLQDLELELALRPASLEVVGTGGEPLPGAAVYVFEAEGGLLGSYRYDGSALELALPMDRSAGALVVAEGCGPAEVRAVAGDCRAVLERGIEITLRPSRSMAQDQGHRGVLLLLSLTEPLPPRWPAGAMDIRLPMGFGESEGIELAVGRPGTYQLAAMVLRRMGTQFGMGPDDRYVPLPSFLSVGEGDRGGVLVLDLPADLFERAQPEGE